MPQKLSFEAQRDRLVAAGQGHIFKFASQLDAAALDQLTAQAASLDLSELATLLASRTLPQAGAAPELSPPSLIPLPRSQGELDSCRDAAELGRKALADGRVAAFTVAGGQGTRLGFDGPKGTFQVSPIRRASLFQLFAEQILAAQQRYQSSIPWLVMTSHINHQETLDFFSANGHFGLDPTVLHFFSQGLMPAVDDKGKILLSSPSSIALSPDGHGGSLRALVRSGAIDRLACGGQDVISYFQVDNPLAHFLDPAFIGHHIHHRSEMSSKAVPKASPEEKVGVFCLQDGRLSVIEYSDLPTDLMHARDADGLLSYRAGNVAMHILSRDFVARVGGGTAALPFHFAHKKVAAIDAQGQPVDPQQPNATKFEMFVFDALPLARRPIVVECSREEEFSPVKNAEGADSPLSSGQDQLRRHARWLKAAGGAIPTDASGLPAFPVEITPSFACSQGDFVTRWQEQAAPPSLVPNLVL